MQIVSVFLLLLAAIGSFLVGAFVLLRDWRKIENIAFFVITFGIVAWAAGIAGFLLATDTVIALWWAKSYYVAPIILVIGSVLFAEYFYHQKQIKRILKLPVFIMGSLIICLLLGKESFLTQLVTHEPFGNAVTLDRGDYWLYSVYLMYSFVLAISMMAIKMRNFKYAIARQQTRTFLIGYSVSCVFGVYFNLLLPALGNYSLIAIGPILTSIFVVSTAYAIIRHRLFDIRAVVARSLAYVITTIFLAAIYGFMVFGVLRVIFDLRIPIYAQIIVSFFMGISGVIFPFIKKLFDSLTQQIFFRDSYEAQELFSSLNRILVSSLDIGYVLGEVTKIIVKEMKSEFGTIVLKSYNEGGSFRVFGAPAGGSNLKDIPLLLRKAGNITGMVQVTDLMEGQSTEELRHILIQNNVAVVVRLSSSTVKTQGTIGYLLLGQKKSGYPYNSNDVRVLDTIARELVIVIQNTLHFEEIQNFNVTLQSKVEEQTRKYRVANEKLKKLDETKDEFISMASHQLRTPLTSVKGYLSMVLEGDAGKLNRQQEDLLKQSFMSSQRMVNLIADLLNLSRLNTGKFVIDAQPTDLRVVIDQEIAQLSETAKAKKIDLQWQMPTTFSMLPLDEGKIHQVVMNFIDNAIYYTPEGGTVTVSLKELESSVEFRVTDSGIGVPREQQKHLFSKFFRAENAKRMRPDGTGLGLYMAKKVVIAQNGAVIFESQEGKGSTFGFRFYKKVEKPETDK